MNLPKHNIEHEILGAQEAENICYDNSTSGLAADNVQSAIDELDSTIDSLPKPLIPKGSITLASDFPTLTNVVNGWFYTISANVTDNDVTKTNTGQTFVLGDEIYWFDGAWIVIENRPYTAGDGIDITNTVITNTDKGTTAVLAQNEITKEPTGFVSPELVTVTGDSTTRTLTLTGTTTAYYRGTLVSELVSGWQSSAHDNDTNKSYFLCYNGTAFEWKDTSTLTEDFYSNVLIALAVYNPTDMVWVYGREPHGLMSWLVHRAEHLNIGTYKRSGGGIGDYTLNSTTISDRQPSVEATLIYDEDVPTTNATLTASGNYTQFYLDGALGTVNFITTATNIVPLSTNRPYFNEFTGGVWQQSLIDNNNYMSIWLVAVPMASDTNSQKLRYMWIQGQEQNANLDDEQSINASSVSLGVLNELLPELVFIGRIIIIYSGGNWRLVEVNSLDGSRYSQTSSPQGNFLSTVSTDTTLTGLGTVASPLSVDDTQLDHNVLINTHNLTTDIDHNSLTNYVANEHFTQTEITEVGTIEQGIIDCGGAYHE